MRVHDKRERGPSQVCPTAHSVCMHIHYARVNRISPIPRVLPDAPDPRYPVYAHAACQKRHFLPSPNSSTANSPSEPHSPQSGRENWNSDPLDIISVTSSSKSPAPPPQRRPRRSPAQNQNRGKQVRLLMAYVLVPPLPRGAHKSDYVPVKQSLRTRERQTAASKGKARAGNNSGSRDLMQALQGAFENNWDSTVAPSWGPKKKKKTTKKPAKEMLVVLMMRTMKRTRGRSPRNVQRPSTRRWPWHSRTTQRILI